MSHKGQSEGHYYLSSLSIMHDSSVNDKNSRYADDSSYYTVGNTVTEIETN